MQKKRFDSVQASANAENVPVVFFVWRSKSSSPGGGLTESFPAFVALICLVSTRPAVNNVSRIIGSSPRTYFTYARPENM